MATIRAWPPPGAHLARPAVVPAGRSLVPARSANASRTLIRAAAKELCALQHHNPFELLVATILSAQCTDERVNLVMPALFARYPTPQALAAADRSELEDLIRSTGFFRSKASHILGASEAIVMRHGGEVPRTMEELTALPGVGRKTANVVLSVGFGLPGLPVDTHVTRLSHRLALSAATDPVKIETDLCDLYPPAEWGVISLRLILHGRRTCHARHPAATSARSPTCARHGENSESILNIRWSPRHLPESLVTGWPIAMTGEEPRRYVRSRNRFPPPGSKTSGVRDPPPGPLPDGALGGAVGASGRRWEQWISRQPACARGALPLRPGLAPRR